jgi:transposase
MASTKAPKEETATRNYADRQAFGKAVDKYAESGDTTTLTSWLDCSYTVDESNTKMTLADMTSTELDFASSYHQKLADTNAFEAAFLAALARKVGESTVGELYTEAQLVEMRKGLQKFSRKRR